MTSSPTISDTRQRLLREHQQQEQQERNDQHYNDDDDHDLDDDDDDDDHDESHIQVIPRSHSHPDLVMDIEPLMQQQHPTISTTSILPTATATSSSSLGLSSPHQYTLLTSHPRSRSRYSVNHRYHDGGGIVSRYYRRLLVILLRPGIYAAFLTTILLLALIATFLIVSIFPKLPHEPNRLQKNVENNGEMKQTITNVERNSNATTNNNNNTNNNNTGRTNVTYSDQPTKILHQQENTSNHLISSLSYLSAMNLPPVSSLHRSHCERQYPYIEHLNISSHHYYYYYYQMISKTQKYFIAVNLYQNKDIIADFLTELTRTITILCQPNHNDNNISGNECSNVFVSIYESNSSDSTAHILKLYDLSLAALHIPHRIITTGDINRSQYHYRIDHLTAIRNAVIEPLYQGDERYDRIIFFNDVLFCTEDVLRLLSHATDNVSMVCGLDYDAPNQHSDHHHITPLFYDTWVMRNIHGKKVSKEYPYFTNDANDDTNSKDAIYRGDVLNVFCCWNGLSIMNARDWYDYKMIFRAHDEEQEDYCEASEVSHICEDYWAIHHEQTHILLDPMVHLAYEKNIYAAIPDQPWFKQLDTQRAKGWNKEQEDGIQQREVINISHHLASWDCCDLQGRCHEHELKYWTEAQKELKKRTPR